MFGDNRSYLKISFGSHGKLRRNAYSISKSGQELKMCPNEGNREKNSCKLPTKHHAAGQKGVEEQLEEGIRSNK